MNYGSADRHSAKGQKPSGEYPAEPVNERSPIQRKSGPDAAAARRGEEGPENGPVDRFHRRTGRQALESYAASRAISHGPGERTESDSKKVRRFIRRMPQAPEGRFEADEVSEDERGGEEGTENDPVDRFHRRTGRQALERLGWGEQRPENRPVACFQLRTGRQALADSPLPMGVSPKILPCRPGRQGMLH